ncbi:MAG: hypothetical protein E7168_02740 [Firmicutes bacterium]|nr:hypothetical protein [Bacillota bacterium]
MWGAIIGDLAGSIYEYDQVKKVSNILVDELIVDESFFSDDTILTVAILDAILEDKNYENYLRKYGKEYLDYLPDHQPYFKTSFSPGFITWIKGDKPCYSIGNGAMMRISPVGYLFDTEEGVLNNVYEATIPSHNSRQTIDCATTVAMIIFLARKGYSKEEIMSLLNIQLTFNPFSKFNSTCVDTIDNCLYALFTTDSFESALKTVISYGGDTDTNACIVGSMAEALYGIDASLIEKAKEKIPNEFVKKIELGYSKITKF